MNWSLLVKELVSSTSHSLWLTSFNTSEKKDHPEKRKVTLTGKADEAEAVPIFMKNLMRSFYFKDVVLTTLEKEKSPKGTFYQFSLDLVAGEDQREKKTL